MIKALSTIGFANYQLPYAVKLMYEYGFEYIDLHYDNIQLHLGNLEYEDLWRVISEYREAYRSAERLGLVVTSIHLPYAGLVKRVFEHDGIWGLYRLYSTLGSIVGPDNDTILVMHPYYSRRLSDNELIELNKLLVGLLARGPGPAIALENLSEGAWSNVNHVSTVVVSAKLNGMNRIWMCLDLGHSHVAGHKPEEVLEEYSSIVRVLHVHDNNGSSDAHLLPGAGTINWLGVSRAAMRLVAGTIVVSEVVCSDGVEVCASRLWLTEKLLNTIFGGELSLDQ